MTPVQFGEGLLNVESVTQRGREEFFSASGSAAGRGAERTAAPGAAVLFPQRTRSHRDGDGRTREERRLEERSSGTEEPDHRLQVR